MSHDLPLGRWVLTDSRGVPVPGVTVTSVELHRKPEKRSGIGGIHCTIPAGEPLVKVLPAGGPLVPHMPTWQCELCGLLSPEKPRATCMQRRDDPSACPMVAPEPLTKALQACGPLVSAWWTCSICGHHKPGGPPSACAVESNLLPPHLMVAGCPLNHEPV